MNITFLIGNGFDLNLGLKTKYSDFIEYYTKTDTNENKLINNFKKDLKHGDINWADAEIAFGEYSDKFASETNGAEMFCECHDDFCHSLAMYLKEQENLLNIDNIKDKFIMAFSSGIKNFPNNFREETQNKINSYIASFNSEIIYNFIIFNYTTILDNLFYYKSQINSQLGYTYVKTTPRNISKSNMINKYIHVHGTYARDMVLGVNDETQIKNTNIFLNYPDEYISQIIKIKTNQMNENNIDKKAESILNKSDLIYIYGMSIGATDKLWWERICNIMIKNPKLILIVYLLNAPQDEIQSRKFVTCQRKFREKFTNLYNSDTQRKNDIITRIYIDKINIFEELKGMLNE